MRCQHPVLLAGCQCALAHPLAWHAFSLPLNCSPPLPRCSVAPQAAQGPRAFSPSVRDKLFARESERGGASGVRCAYCGMPIVHVTDAEVDHVVPYASGGRTTLDNAQLLHTLCNREKGKKSMNAAPAAGGADVAGEGGG